MVFNTLAMDGGNNPPRVREVMRNNYRRRYAR
jgi:hypothetical protein